MEATWRRIIEAVPGFVPPVPYPLPLVANSRARGEFNRSCLKIDTAGLPEVPCVYVMRRRASEILRIGTAAKGLCDRIIRGYNRPCQATHPLMTLERIYYEWQNWAGGAHLTNALVMFGLSRAIREGELDVEVHAFAGELLTWERLMLDAYVKAFGARPALNRGHN